MSRLKERYNREITAKLMKEFGYTNPMQVPRLEKLLINMGLGEAIQNIKVLDSAMEEIKAITGQKPVATKARRSIANFKLRKGMPIGPSPGAGFQGRFRQVLRRKGKLLAGHQGADHLS
jgi:large subunit ribosomal protein L5